jgi:hypothetical protein
MRGFFAPLRMTSEGEGQIQGFLLAALNSGTRFTVMPSPGAKLCRHPVERYGSSAHLVILLICREGR